MDPDLPAIFCLYMLEVQTAGLLDTIIASFTEVLIDP
jgi:hypothetical protein